MSLEKIITGGQTGVDRGTLDVALELGFPCGGSCPADRAAEDGMIPPRYPLTPLPGGGYRERTLQNVLDSDGTVIISRGPLTGGTLLTRDLCRHNARPHLVIDAPVTTEADAAREIARFIEQHDIRVLNVAGPRSSQWQEAHAFASRTVRELLSDQPRRL
ncbi:MAG: putative molybdenum carrier protein [Steroidobacteraceae bacterium]